MKSILEVIYSPVLLMPGMSVISYDEEDYYCGRTGTRLVKNKTGEISSVCDCHHVSCSSLLFFTRAISMSLSWI